MMNEDTFWQLIEQSRKQSDDPDEQADALAKILKQRTPEELIEFDKIMYDKRKELYRWDLWGIGYIVNGGCSDDGFEYFRCWVIGQGKAFYDKALADPESITEVTDPEEDWYENEQLMYAASIAYEAITDGQQMPPVETRGPLEPVGKSWEEDELPDLFPKACEKYDW